MRSEHAAGQNQRPQAEEPAARIAIGGFPDRDEGGPVGAREMLRGGKSEAGLHEHVRLENAGDEVQPGVRQLAGRFKTEAFDSREARPTVVRNLPTLALCSCDFLAASIRLRRVEPQRDGMFGPGRRHFRSL